MNYSKTIIFILLNILFISTFIVVFFLSYGHIIEKDITIKQLTFLIDNIYNDIRLSGKSISDTIKNQINNYTIPDATAQDNYINTLNKQTINKAIKWLSIFIIIILLIIVFIYYKNKNINIKHIIKQSIIIFIFVGFTYYIFLSFFNSSYIYINSNNVKLFIIKKIHEKYLKLN